MKDQQVLITTRAEQVITYEHQYPKLIAAVTFIIAFVIGIWLMVDSQEKKRFLQQDHLHRFGHVVVSSLEQDINLLASIPHLLHSQFKLVGPAKFSEIFQSLVGEVEGPFQSAEPIFSLAPQGRISNVYPPQVSQSLYGMDLFNSAEGASIERARQQRKPVLSKSWSLLPGKQMLVVHYPVFSGSDEHFWGVISAMVELESLLSQRATTQLNHHDQVLQLIRSDADGNEQLFYQGDRATENTLSVSHYINLPDGNWTLRVSSPATSAASLAWLGWSFMIASLLAATAFKLSRLPQLLKDEVMERTSQLAAHDRFLNDLISSLPVGIAVSDTNADIRYSNPVFNQMMSAEVEEGNSLINWLGESVENANMRQFLLSRISLSEVDFDVTVRIADKDFQLTCSHIISAQGKLLVWVFRDVTEISHINRTLRNVSATRAEMLRLLPDPMAFFNKKGELMESNPSFQALFADMVDVEAGFSCSDFEQRLLDTTQVQESFRPVSALELPLHQQAVYVDEYVMPGPPRREFERTICFDNSSNTVGSIMHFRDVTAAHEVDRMKTEFLSTAAHELRTPLANIFGYTELLIKAQFDKTRQDELLGIIYNQTRRLSTIIDDLLDLARIEARAGEVFKFAWHQLGDILQNVLNELELELSSHPFENVIAAEVGQLWCDADKIEQVIENLLSNAIKYSPDNTPIKLESGPEHRDEMPGYLIRVQDQGIGMNRHDIEHVFDRFYRSDTSGQVPGTGLGMAIVKEIITHHRGRIDIDSEPGHGTTVTVWLPRQQPENGELVEINYQSA